MEEHPSAPSVRCGSVRSMENPILFQKTSSPSALREESKEASLDQSQGLGSGNARFQQGASAAAPSCWSLKSDSSIERPYYFKRSPALVESRAVQCCLSDGSNVHQREACHVRYSPVMTELRAQIMQFMESELEYLDGFLSEETEWDAGQSRHEPDDEDSRLSREAVLHLCAHFLRDMKQEGLAQQLLRRITTTKCVSNLKSRLKNRFQHVFEGAAKAGHRTDLNEIYTDLCIIEGDTPWVSDEHESRLIQAASHGRQGRSISYQDLFNNRSVRTTLTKGVAGIGKTLCVQKVLLDWIEEKTHRDIRLMLPLSFRELNVLRGTAFSLVSLVQHFFSDLKDTGVCSLDDECVVLIIDGLDESRFKLDFRDCPSVTDTRELARLDVLLVNLIRGKLLPSTRLWITTRPAAAGQIPAECISRVTEVCGFSDPQKAQYFRNRIEDEKQAAAVISHMTTHPSLHVMCQIPIFCWILSTVLLHLLGSGVVGQLPQTLTQMFIHFLVVQIRVKNLKYDGHSDPDNPWNPETKKMVESLGELAFDQLLKRNLIFYESDLTKYGLDLAAVRSGVLTQVFREESGLYQGKVYCFVHLSVQEFLAALYVHLTFFNSGVNLLADNISPPQRLKPVKDKMAERFFYLNAVDKALRSSNGHLDLFLRFLLGLSLKSNHNLLKGLTKHIQPSSQISREVIACVKAKIAEDLPSDKTINLFHCLNELGNRSLQEEVQMLLSAEHLSELRSAHWSALVFMLLLDKCDMFELKTYFVSEEVFFRLLPVIKMSQESNLSGCSLSLPSWKALATVLKSESCRISELVLNSTELQDSGLTALADGLSSRLRKLRVLRLRGCGLTEGSCRTLCDLLSSPQGALEKLDLSENKLQDGGLRMLSEGLQSSHCALTSLSLDDCALTSRSCEELSAVLRCQTSVLHDLSLSNNWLQDSGVEVLCSGLMSPHCSLQTLSLSGCLITEKGFAHLKHALTCCQLKHLDLRYNHPGDQIQSVEDEQRLRTDHAAPHRLKPGLGKYSCELTEDHNTAHGCLIWFANNFCTEDTEETQRPEGQENFEFWHQVLCCESLTGRCYWEVKWRGLVSIGVTYKSIERKGKSRLSMLGGNRQSWTLDCSLDYYFARHNGNVAKRISRKALEDDPCEGADGTVGVYLDWDEGVLSFFTVQPEDKKLIYTFYESFSEPLLAGFRLRSEFTFNSCNFFGVCPMQT